MSQVLENVINALEIIKEEKSTSSSWVHEHASWTPYYD
jgi:hypothetical protein